MDIKEEKKAIKNLKASYMEDWDLTEDEKDDLDALVYRVLMVGKEEGKQQATPEGFVLVKKELSRKSIRLGLKVLQETDDIEKVFGAMIEAQEQSHD